MKTPLTDLPIVVVEDDPEVLSLIASLLRAHDFHNVLTFGGGRDALDFLKGSAAAAVVLDLAMPDVSGLDILHYICVEKPDIPAVIVTGERQLETAIECMKMGAVDFLTKPVHVDRLIDSVASALQQRRTGGHAAVTAAPGGDRGLVPEGVPERLGKAARYMAEHLSHPTYLEKIAGEACLSKFHFSREFKKYFGVTPMQFMLRLRIARASSLLLSRPTSVSRIASECGFSDQSEFTKWFKKATGLTPSRFRRSLGAGAEDEQAPVPTVKAAPAGARPLHRRPGSA